MEQNIQKTSGNLKVSEEVVSTIVKQVLEEIDGVAGLAAPPVAVKDMILKSGVSKPVKITLNSDVAVIDISISLKFGYKIKDVTEKLQNTVKEEVQNMTGIAVSAVNIYVAGVTAEK